MRRAVYFISVDGIDISSDLEPILIRLAIVLTDGGKSDTLEIDIDDSEGRVRLPREGADVIATISWDDGSGGGAVRFEGKSDQPTSQGTRGGGMIMSITAHATDMKDKPKHKNQKHKDDGSFEDAAKEFAKTAGLKATVTGKLKNKQRKYWDMRNESFMAWGVRMAQELGATFKIQMDEAIFVPRNSSESITGKPLLPVRAIYGDNLIKWELTPIQNRPRYHQSIVRWYDMKEAKYKKEKVDIGDRNLPANLTETMHAPDKDQAGDLADSNSEEAKRGKGVGTVTIDGDPAAQSQAPIFVIGLRDGIDGEYKITTARHELNRRSGWTVDLDLELPSGDAGIDDRRAG